MSSRADNSVYNKTNSPRCLTTETFLREKKEASDNIAEQKWNLLQQVKVINKSLAPLESEAAKSLLLVQGLMDMEDFKKWKCSLE